MTGRVSETVTVARSSTAAPRGRALLTTMFGGLLIGVIALAPGWGRRALWDPDETRYADVATDMVERGAWFDPHLNGADSTSKPPPFSNNGCAADDAISDQSSPDRPRREKRQQ